MPTLEPVDYDPFAGLQPVDYDPWDGRPMPSTYEESRMDAAQRRLEPVDHDPFADVSNLEAADKTLNLTPQERALYQRHLTNLNGPGGVDNPNGSRSTLFQMSFEQDGKTYNIPTVWDGKILNPDDAIKRAEKEGLDKFPSYGSENEAEARYQRMHDYMERDTGAFLSRRAASQAASTYNDPFSSAPAPSGRAQEKFNKIADALAAGAKNWIETPGRAIREGITTDQAVDWAAPTALGMVAGARLPGGAPDGALGSSGAKLVQPEGIRAYHGSPYDFDRFDASKIGTGEGAQAYGHGLYFAEAEPTALSYKNMMKTTDMDWPVAGTDLKLPAWVARSSRTPQGLDEVRNNFLGRIEESKARLDGGDWNAQTQIYHQQKIIDALDAVKAGAEVKQPGHMYEVNIGAKPEQFLDWDKPLSQQGEPARKALNDIWGLPSKEAQTTMTGDDAYRAMGITFHQPGRGHLDNSTVSGALREAGIPGIRYLDQGSRGAQVPAFDQHLYKPWGGKLDVPEPTRNYVVFDPGIVDILRKYGLAGLTAGGAANYAAGLRGEQ